MGPVQSQGALKAGEKDVTVEELTERCSVCFEHGEGRPGEKDGGWPLKAGTDSALGFLRRMSPCQLVISTQGHTSAFLNFIFQLKFILNIIFY